MAVRLVAYHNYLSDRYLIMLDERIHSTKGGLEGRTPVGRFFRYVEEYLRALCKSLCLC